ncbi:hypothetical protein MMC07_008728 [Pseudocyphellaria aurata]|nr:hypothetical protein [Pseudocyphellaria aurata]
MSSTDSKAKLGEHLAAVVPSKGSALEVVKLPTFTPAPDELLIEVKSIALNPVDHYQRDFGFFINSYPATIGSDIAGVVVSAGSAVPKDAPKPGTRIAAFATTFYDQGAKGHGGLQERVLVPAVNVVPLPQGMSFNEASLLPMAVATVWAGWYTIGLPRDTAYTAADKKGILVWGGASSVGSAALQIAKMMGFTVYVTASEKHHEYLKTLGATNLFDYKDENVVEKILKAAKEDGVKIEKAYLAVGDLKPCLDILKEFKEKGDLKVASAPRLPENAPSEEDVEIKFVMAPNDAKERAEHFHFIFGVWLKEKLETGEFVPSPKIKVVEGGLEAAQKALDELKSGVSGTKLVLEF